MAALTNGSGGVAAALPGWQGIRDDFRFFNFEDDLDDVEENLDVVEENLDVVEDIFGGC